MGQQRELQSGPPAADPDRLLPERAAARNHASDLSIAGFRRQPLHGERMATSVSDAAWLKWMTKLMDSSAGIETASPAESEGFGCVLDEQPTHLVPDRLLQQIRGAGAELTFNPHCYVTGQGKQPAVLAEAEQAL